MTIPNHHKNILKSFLCTKMSLRAFTLVEILLVISLFAVTSLAIYQTFSSGLKIWDHATKFFPEEDVLLSLERMAEDLHNTFYFSLFEFKGDHKGLEITTIVTTLADPRASAIDAYVKQIGRVRYVFDEKKGQITRQQADYGQSASGQWQRTVVLAQGVAKASFTYLFQVNGRLVEKDRAKGIMPAMVRVKIDYQAGKEIRQMIRLIDIPASLSSL